MTTDHQQIPQQLHSLKLTSPLKMVVSSKNLLFQAMSVSFREGTPIGEFPLVRDFRTKTEFSGSTATMRPSF